jgi:DNA processing protein
MKKVSINGLVDIIRLIRSENVGTKTFWHLISLYKNASTALEKIEELSVLGGRDKSIKIFPLEKAEEEIEKCKSMRVDIISYLDSDFPSLLKNTDDCPPLLFCIGNTKLLNQSTVAIVGSRNASINGLRFAYKIAKDLSDNNKIVVSGFARGIDTASHKASLEKGTIAVLAGGVDHIYPQENTELYESIASQGLIVAELPLGSIPKPQNFPQRNRIISGLSQGVAVIEATLKSGSLITAKIALQQSREVFVVPGFPLDPRYQGNNYLLKQGAYLLESAKDILEVLESTEIKRYSLFEQESEILDIIKTKKTEDLTEKELTQARSEIIKLVTVSPTSIDEIISITKISHTAALTAIVELELAGKVIRHYGNKISVKY